MTGVILDRFGNPLSSKPATKKQLSEDIARPRSMSIRHPKPHSVASSLTPHRLSSLLKAVVEGSDPESYMILAEEMEERDLHYASVLRTRKLKVASVEPTVVAAGESDSEQRHADLVREVMGHDRIPELLFDLLDGLGKGLSAVQIIWDTRQTPWKPRDYKWVDSRWLRPDLDSMEHVLLISDEYPQGYPLEQNKYLLHAPRSKSGNVWRNGLARLVSVMYMLKSFTLRDWWAFAEIFGIPFRVGKYGPNAKPDDIDTLITAVTNMASDGGAVIPDSMKIDLLESKTSGGGGDTLFEHMADWCDRQTSKAVLGQTMTTDDGSSMSQAQVHNDVRMDIAAWDARQLSATINRWLVRPLIDLNYGPQPRYPTVTIEVPVPEDVAAMVNALTPLVDRGLPVAANAMYGKFGLQEPDQASRILHPMGQPAGDAAGFGTDLQSIIDRQVKTAVNRALNRSSAKTDSIDEMVSEAVSEWEEVADESINPVLELAQRCASYEMFLQELPSLQEQLGTEAFTDSMTRYLFQARGVGDATDG